MAKFAREQRLKERRAQKQEKKAALRDAKAAGAPPAAARLEDETGV